MNQVPGGMIQLSDVDQDLELSAADIAIRIETEAAEPSLADRFEPPVFVVRKLKATVSRDETARCGYRGSVAIDPSSLVLLGSKASEADRRSIASIVASRLLEVKRYRYILFYATDLIAAKDGHHVTVHGKLILHGKDLVVSILMDRASEGSYTGELILKQSDFGIASLFPAALRLKDGVRVKITVTLPSKGYAVHA